MVGRFSPPEKIFDSFFLRGRKKSDYFGEDKNNPNWRRYKAHFTYWCHTC
jgi:hypothetical protein